MQPTDKELAALAKVWSVLSRHVVMSCLLCSGFTPSYLPHAKCSRSCLSLTLLQARATLAGVKETECHGSRQRR